jgi:CP family cyanate transporter-like MFS transporter
MAAAGPLAIGVVHDISGSWTPALIVLLALMLPLMVMGLEAARNRTVRQAPSPA